MKPIAASAGTVLAVLCLTLLVWSTAAAETLLTEARILKVTERGFIFRVGTEPLAVEDGPDAKFWKGKAAAKRGSFTEGEVVFLRLKTDSDPPQLREMADKDTWKWLDNARKTAQLATIEKIDSKYITVKFGDGSTFLYRYTEKSEIKLKDKPEASIADVSVGMRLYVQGRTLANLDTWLLRLSDEAPPAKAAPKPATKAAPPAPLPQSGKLEGVIEAHASDLKMIDIAYQGRTLHVSYKEDTKFFLNLEPAKPGNIARGITAVIYYTRDKTGRIIASKVELYRANLP
jgi:hypothetical protein